MLQLPIPGIVGISTEPYVNAASVKNEGWEFALGYNDQWGDWTFGANVNFSKVKMRFLTYMVKILGLQIGLLIWKDILSILIMAM